MIPLADGWLAQAATPGARLEVFGGAGHFPYRDDLPRFLAVLEDFMATTEPGTYDQERWRTLLRNGDPDDAVTGSPATRRAGGDATLRRRAAVRKPPPSFGTKLRDPVRAATSTYPFGRKNLRAPWASLAPVTLMAFVREEVRPNGVLQQQRPRRLRLLWLPTRGGQDVRSPAGAASPVDQAVERHTTLRAGGRAGGQRFVPHRTELPVTSSRTPAAINPGACVGYPSPQCITRCWHDSRDQRLRGWCPLVHRPRDDRERGGTGMPAWTVLEVKLSAAQ